MRVLLSILVISCFSFLVTLGALRVFLDLLAMSTHRPPFLADEHPEGEWQLPDGNGPGTSSFAVDAPASRVAESPQAHAERASA